jgi:hypothetical protein
MIYVWKVGERGALTASGRRFTVIAERCSGSAGYIERVKFTDDESEIEIAHNDLVTNARRLTYVEEKC